MADAYRIQFEKVPLSNGGYTMNHTADILLFDRAGAFVDFLPYFPPNMRGNETVAAAEEGRTMTKLRALVGS